MIGVLAARRHGAYSFLTCARTQTFIQRYMETLEQRIQRVAQEDVAITPYDPRWPELFRQEKGHLLNCLPNELIRRIEHFDGGRLIAHGPDAMEVYAAAEADGAYIPMLKYIEPADALPNVF